MLLKPSAAGGQRRFTWIVSLAALATAVLALRSLCPAQEPGDPPVMARDYTELREIDGKAIVDDRRNRTKVFAILRAGTFADEDEKTVVIDHYKFRVAEMTWIDNLNDLPKRRRNFKSQDMQDAKKAGPQSAVHDFVNNFMLTACVNIALDTQYHPASRLNCMLIAAALDQQEPTSLDGSGAVPYAAALPKLLAAAKDPAQIDAVRVAALLGVVRHSDLIIPPEQRGPTVVALVEIVNNEKPGEAGTLVGNTWMRRRASQALGLMAAKYPEASRPEVADALKKLMDDPHADLLARCDAAFALGTIEKSALSKDKLQGYVTAAAKVAAKIGSSGTVSAPETGGADPGRANVEFLTYALNHVQAVFNGNGPNRGVKNTTMDDATKQMVNQVSLPLSNMLRLASDQNRADNDRNELLKKESEKLDEFLKTAAP